MKVTKKQIRELVFDALIKEGLFDKKLGSTASSGTTFGDDSDKESKEETNKQVSDIENKLSKVSGLEDLMDKIKTSEQIEDLFTGLVGGLDSAKQESNYVCRMLTCYLPKICLDISA